MNISRRRFVESSALGALYAGFGYRSSSLAPTQQTAALRILILGGTGFIGPHMVREAMSRGHTVTLFNRGRTNTHLFPKVEKLRGDRDGQLDALRGHEWDVVIDNTGYVPRHVRDSAELLKGHVGHYVFTSTTDVYRDYHVAGIDEDYPLATHPEPGSEDARKYYGPLKVLCERAVRDVYPDRSMVVRPGWIVGPEDNNHLFTYWVMRVARGGEVLAPGSPRDPMQVTEARDLSAFMIRMAEEADTGTYNLVGPVTTMESVLSDVQAATESDARFTWVDADFLWAHGVKPWSDMPIWWPPRNDYADRSFGGITGGVGALALDGRRARARGLRHRPLAETVRDILEWYRASFQDWPDHRRPGLSAAKEAEVLAAWHRTEY